MKGGYVHKPVQQAVLLDMIGRIYDAAHQPELWPEVLAEVDTLTQAETSQESPSNNPYFDLLQPHLLRAIEMSDSRQGQQNEHIALINILDHMPMGIITANKNNHVCSMNNAAKLILGDNRLLNIKHDELHANTLKQTQKLHQCIALAHQGSPQSLVLMDKNQETCLLHIKPTLQNSTDSNTVTILIATNQNQQQKCADNLAASFHLTPSEGKLLCALLGENHSLTEAAEALGISKHTARAQAKSIFVKTGTNSQSELLKKVFQGFEFQAYNQPQTHGKNESSDVEIENIFHTITLNDGGCLEYTEYGDPSGVPVLYFHGIIHSRQKFHPSSDYAETHGIRIIAPERPGFGATSRQKNMSLVAFAKNIKQLVNHLNVAKFYVLGEGSGGASALACAAVLSDQVIRTSIVACVPDKQFDQLKALHPFERQLYNIKQASSRKLSFALGKTVLKMLSKHDRLIFLMKHFFHHTDWEIVQSQGYRQMYQDSMRNTLPHNSEGFLEDYFARTNNWDFRTQHISAHVNVWHGDSDPHTKIQSAHNIAKSIPNCTTHFLEGHGHYIFLSHHDEILRKLISTPAIT